MQLFLTQKGVKHKHRLYTWFLLFSKQKTQHKKTKKSHLVVFFKIPQIHKTFINPYHDTIDNTYKKTRKTRKKQLKIPELGQDTQLDN